MRTILFVSAVLILCFVGAAEASDPTGVYAVIERVELVPNAEKPEQIILHGAFSLSSGRRHQLAPQWGTLRFSLPEGQEQDARKEWADLASVAGKREVYGFGSRRDLKGAKLYRSGEKAGAPTPYPMGWGVHKARNARWGAAGLLWTLPKPFSPARPGSEMKPIARGMHEIELVADNALAPTEGTRYLFEIETRRAGVVASPAIASGDKQTSWKTWLYLESDELVRWSVRIVRADYDRFAVARSEFKVKADGE